MPENSKFGLENDKKNVELALAVLMSLQKTCLNSLQLSAWPYKNIFEQFLAVLMALQQNMFERFLVVRMNQTKNKNV